MRAVRFPVSFSLLEMVLDLPNAHFIVGIDQDSERGCHFIVEGPDFPEGVTDIDAPVVTKHRPTWDWGLG